MAPPEGRQTHRGTRLARDSSRKGCFSHFTPTLFNWDENVSPVDDVHRNHFLGQEHGRMHLTLYSWAREPPENQNQVPFPETRRPLLSPLEQGERAERCVSLCR